MTFDEILLQVLELLQREGRVSYRALKRRFALDDDYVEDLKAELIDAKHLAVDEDGKVLVWIGKGRKGETAKRGNGEKKVVSSQLSVVSPQPLAPSTQPPAGERRQLTVEFIDLVGSTTLSAQLDPEDYHARVVAYQTICHQVIARYEGHIAQYLGDGVLVYFGYPSAHEEDAVRAVRSGLEIVTAVGQLAYTPLLQVRIGIHTGPVVVGEIGAGERTERLALGETPNVTARIQGQANPDEVMISTATYHLVEGFFACEDRGQPELKGVTTPLTLYRVVKENEAQNRFDVAIQAGLTPLVGREEELVLLRRRWQQAMAGEGQVILLSGEPGIGKSRLVQELKEHVIAEGATRIEFRCSPYHQNSALYPIINHLQRLLRFEREDSPAEKLKKLEEARAGAHRGAPLPPDALPLLAALLSLPHPEGYPLLTFSPQKQKEKTHEALVTWLIEETRQNTVYNVWEDLHWADPSTLEVLNLVVDQAPTTKLYMLLTFRPEFTPPWGNRSHLSQLTLSRLGRDQVKAMVEQVTGGTALPREMVQQIVSKTDGVPLFVEELTKTVVESVGALREAPLRVEIPATLQDSLMARLDRLGPAKEIAQLGATLGREFSYELLHAVSLTSEETLQHGLKQLVKAELVYQRGLPPQVTYLFKHALIQDAAYQSLLKSTRQRYHRQIAQRLEEQFPETKETQPELLAHHYTEAGLIAQAIPYWQSAGQRAGQRSAYVEAVAHLTKGLEVLKAVPHTSERVQQELTLQFALGDALVAVKGYAAPEVEKTVQRARALSQQLGETPQLFPVLFRLWVFSLMQWGRELRTTHELAEQLMRVAQSVQDQFLLSLAHAALGVTLFWLGELTLARSHLEQAIALYDPKKHPRFNVGTADPRVDCLSYAAWALWSLGYPVQGLKRSHEAVVLAEGLSHPFSRAYALGTASLFHLLRREEQLARERAEAAMILSTEQGFPFFLAYGMLGWGSALAEQGQETKGIAQMQQGLDALRDMGTEPPWIGHLPALAAAYAKIGKVEEGRSVLAEALAHMHKTGMRMGEAELYRLRGELTLAQSSVQSLGSRVQTNQRAKGKRQKAKIETNPQSLTPNPQGEVEQEAEECFHKALEIARQQQAKSLELRASMSLARLWQGQGKRTEAHKLLSEVYTWFTEGFDTKDLQEAKALIEGLGH